MKSTFKWLLGSVFLLALMAYIQLEIGWAVLLQPWQNFSALFIGFLIGLIAMSYVFRALRLHLLLSESTQASRWQFLRINLIHTAAINFLPMRLGEAVFPILMKKQFDHSITGSASILVWIRLLDLFCLIWISGLILSMSQTWLFSILLALGLVCMPTAWGLHVQFEKRLQNPRHAISRFLKQVLQHLPRTSKTYYMASFWTIMAWSVKLLTFSLVLQTLVELPMDQLIGGVVASELASSIPIQGIAGFGTYEAAMALGLQHTELNQEQMIQAGFNLHIFILSSSLVFAMLAWVINKPTQANPGQP